MKNYMEEKICEMTGCMSRMTDTITRLEKERDQDRAELIQLRSDATNMREERRKTERQIEGLNHTVHHRNQEIIRLQEFLNKITPKDDLTNLEEKVILPEPGKPVEIVIKLKIETK